MQTKPEPLVSVRDLQTYYSIRGSFVDRLVGREAGSVKAVDDVSFDLRKGEVLGLVGESGSGKTTLGRTLLGLVRATGGSVKFEGRDITKLSERELRAAPPADADRLPGPARVAEPGDDDRAGGRAPAGDPQAREGPRRRAAARRRGARDRRPLAPRSSSWTSTRPTSRAARSSGR